MEEVLHYIWKYNLYTKNLKTICGKPIEVIDCGIHNHDSGPDFFNAKMKIGGIMWVGNVEIHTSSDKWEKHGHHKDKNYDSIILHITTNANANIITSEGREVPQCQISYSQDVETKIHQYKNTTVSMPCANFVNEVPRVKINSWIHSLLIERLERKTKDIENLLKQNINSWEEVFYILLFRSFGFGLNSDIFERLAKNLPISLLRKHSDNIFQIEALLFGQAGMLDGKLEDKYQEKLRDEYSFLRLKYGLNPLDSHLFKRMRTRPASSPQLRIAQIASILYTYPNLFNRIITAEDAKIIRLILHCNPSEYWQFHYNFGVESPKKSKYLGESSLDILIINAVCPILFSYGKYLDDDTHCEKAIKYLESIKAEDNSITRSFAKLQLTAQNAYDSQAFIQLKREYCEKKKCLYCRIGHATIASKVNNV